MAHPYASHRQTKHERDRVGHITRGYASGGAVIGKPKRARGGMVEQRRATAERDAQAVEGGAAKERMDRPGRARGGRAKHKGNNVNVIVAPQGHAAGGPPMMPPPGLGGAGAAMMPPPRPPMMPPPGPPGMPPGGPPMGGPPGMAGPPGMPPRKAGGRTYARGGGV